MNNDWLSRALEESRARGYLGPSAIEPHIAHAEGFALCWEDRMTTPPASFLDLGSGGGLPGLVLLQHWRRRAVFTDSMAKRANFLSEVLDWTDSPPNGDVIVGRVEEVARIPRLEECFDLVTARSFGPPSVTAECGVRFLKVGGLMIVSEPPDDSVTDRWSPQGLALLGLESQGRVRSGSAFQILLKVHPTAKDYPRGVGIPRKKPIF
jgi:16S rRNA (guanine527-N7)-methyltransferase